SFHYNKSLNFATLPRNQLSGSQRSEQMSFMFSVVAEPKLPLLGVGQAKLTLAVDDQDNSLLPPPVQYATYEAYHGGYYGYRNLVLQTQVQLVGPGPRARAVRHLRGTLPGTLGAELTDEKGANFAAHGFNWTNGTPTSVQGTFMFGEPGGGVQVGKPAKLTYYGWVTLQHQVEFEFRDLPLP